jgi:bifunctional DNA-binding transcriptional regulator/antitoxin component of YhaV-PrlF toxin-antitoxin module
MGKNKRDENRTFHVLKVLDGYRITIPRLYCEELEIDKGDHVIIRKEAHALTIEPADVVPRHNP